MAPFFDNLSFDKLPIDKSSIAELPPKLSVGLGALGSLFFLSYALWIGYTLTIHPLAQYPGPFLAKITGFYSVYHAYIGDLHLDMLRCHEKYGEFVRYGPSKVVTNSEKAVQDIYGRNANVQKSTAYRAFETSPTAHDLQSTVNKKEHQRKRRVMSQAFSESALRKLEDHVLIHVKTFVDRLSSGGANGEKVEDTEKLTPGSWTPSTNLARMCSYVSFDLMAELVFGKAFHMLDNSDNRFIIDLIQVAAFRVGVCLQMPFLAVWQVDKIFTPGVRKTRDQYVSVSKKMAVDRMNMDSNRQDLFSHILAAKDPETGKGFSMDELWGESTLLIIAGSDAISTGMAAVFYYMGRHPAAYKKVCEEVRSTFSSSEEIRTGDKLTSCKYLRACIDESMRMSPPVGGALWREVCAGGVNIQGRHVPKGYDVGVPIYAIHHNAEYYPDPYTFLPERWLPGGPLNNTPESVDLAKRAFQAFSIGPVGCVGKNLAYMELTVTMARVAYALEMRPAAGGEVEKVEEKKERYLEGFEKHASLEYRLRDRFTSWKDGPMLNFRVHQS